MRLRSSPRTHWLRGRRAATVRILRIALNAVLVTLFGCVAPLHRKVPVRTTHETWSEMSVSAMDLVNLLGVIAAPDLARAWDAANQGTLKANLLDAIGHFDKAADTARLGAAGQTGIEPLLRLRACSMEFRPMLRAAPDNLDSTEYRTKARECIAAMGIPEPTGGWDSFRGYPPSP